MATTLLDEQRDRQAQPKARTMPDRNLVLSEDPWEALFAWGDEFREATGITREDIRKVVEEVRSCES